MDEMPIDKWNIPFFHPSKASGFFFQMSNTPKNDSAFCGTLDSDFSFPSSGVFRMNPNGPTSFAVAKHPEFKDSIGGCGMDFAQTESRGYAYKPDDPRDIEFKALVKISGLGGNGFSISGPTGHHTSSGCCQGFTYMITCEVGENPSSFRFRKEMYHVSYFDAPNGSFTHSKCNFKIDGINRYVGIGYCRYNNPTEEGTVVLEVWFNPDPDNNINDWTMLKKIVDNGGWGSGGNKCGGDRDQIGTWSNAHFRMKTNATSGTIDFKSLSLREIDPLASFDDNPTGGGGTGGGGSGSGSGGQPPSTSAFFSLLKLQRHINYSDANLCSGSGGGGGGSGGTSKFYSVTPESGKEKELSDSSTFQNRKRVAEKITSSASPIKGKIVKQADVWLKKAGTPGASPVVNFKIWNSSNTVKYTSTTDLDPTTLTTSFVQYAFDCSSNTYTCQNGDRIGVEYLGTSSSNYVIIAYSTNGGTGATNAQQSQYEGSSWDDKSSRDVAMDLWT